METFLFSLIPLSFCTHFLNGPSIYWHNVSMVGFLTFFGSSLHLNWKTNKNETNGNQNNNKRNKNEIQNKNKNIEWIKLVNVIRANLEHTLCFNIFTGSPLLFLWYYITWFLCALERERVFVYVCLCVRYSMWTRKEKATEW